MNCKSSKSSERPQKSLQEDQFFTGANTHQSSIAKLLVSLLCQVKIRKGQAEEIAWSERCNRWWWPTCGMAQD